MAQITTGLRSVLSAPWAYDFFLTLLGAHRGRRLLADDHLRARPGDHILDIGCGTGEMLRFLPRGVHYIGFDLSQRYVDAARAQHGDLGRFECSDVSDFDDASVPQADLVMAIGILHHLDDAQSDTLIRTAYNKLRPGGRLVTFDGTFVEGQSAMARALVARDRGQNIRSPEGYEKLAAPVFGNIKNIVRHDLLRLPYTHCILECTR
jgi:cyclopropane fatty-acyl-phospholipid synthase-like methyltransferase